MELVERVEALRERFDAVELSFRGEFAGDKFSAEMLEYLVSGPEKDYETLLVAPASSLAGTLGAAANACLAQVTEASPSELVVGVETDANRAPR